MWNNRMYTFFYEDQAMGVLFICVFYHFRSFHHFPWKMLISWPWHSIMWSSPIRQDNNSFIAIKKIAFSSTPTFPMLHIYLYNVCKHLHSYALGYLSIRTEVPPSASVWPITSRAQGTLIMHIMKLTVVWMKTGRH